MGVLSARFFALTTFLEIFPVGLLVALVSAALLRNPRVLPARNPSPHDWRGSPNEREHEATPVA